MYLDNGLCMLGMDHINCTHSLLLDNRWVSDEVSVYQLHNITFTIVYCLIQGYHLIFQCHTKAAWAGI